MPENNDSKSVKPAVKAAKRQSKNTDSGHQSSKKSSMSSSENSGNESSQGLVRQPVSKGSGVLRAEKGDSVFVEYVGTLDDGQVFDGSERTGQPLQFEIGGGLVIKGFDAAVTGMKVGDEKDVRLSPAEAYGMPRPELNKKVPRTQMPQDKEIAPGVIMLATLPDGQQFPVKVIEVSDTEVTLDLNHPLAGLSLNFKVKLVKIEKRSGA